MDDPSAPSVVSLGIYFLHTLMRKERLDNVSLGNQNFTSNELLAEDSNVFRTREFTNFTISEGVEMTEI